MRILQINSVCGQGSTGKIAVDIYRLLLKSNNECCIAYGRGRASSDVNSYRIGSDFDVYLHAFLSRVTDKQGLYSTDATYNLVDKIKEYKPDVIHLHNIHGYYLNYRVLFSYLKTCNIPIVWTLHDCWPFTGHCAYFDYVGCDKWKTGCNHCSQIATYPKSLILDNCEETWKLKKEIFTGIKRVVLVTPSKWLANLIRQSFLKEYSINVINNGIDLNVFRPTKSKFREKNHLENQTIILGVASPWTYRKGLRDFIKLSKVIKTNVCIVLVGLDSEQIKKLPPNIIGITRTNNLQELAGLYSTADVFFNPTYEDNYPTTNLEAIACGTPVITYNTGGSSESVLEGCGIVIPKGKMDDIPFLLDKVYLDESHATCLKYSNNFGASIYEKYIKLYHKLLLQ